jgi:hypothetical protein
MGGSVAPTGSIVNAFPESPPARSIHQIDESDKVDGNRFWQNVPWSATLSGIVYEMGALEQVVRFEREPDYHSYFG